MKEKKELRYPCVSCELTLEEMTYLDGGRIDLSDYYYNRMMAAGIGVVATGIPFWVLFAYLNKKSNQRLEGWRNEYLEQNPNASLYDADLYAKAQQKDFRVTGLEKALVITEFALLPAWGLSTMAACFYSSAHSDAISHR